MVSVRKIDGPLTQQCTGPCGASKPLDDFYVRDKKSGRLFARCKACMAAASKDRYAKDAARINERSRAWQQANRERANANSNAWRRANAARVLALARAREATPEYKAQRAAYRSANKDKRIAAGADYRARNRERIRESDARYRAEHKDVLPERQRQWRLDNPERYTEIHSQYKATNKDTVNAATHRRRAKLNGNGGSWTAAEWKALKDQYDHMCLMCGRREPEIRLTVDHVVPVAIGGVNTIDNIQPLCKTCNSLKHTQVLDLRVQYGRA